MTNLLTTPPSSAAVTRCRVSFGRTVTGVERCPRGLVLGVSVPLLAGRSDEELLRDAAAPTQVEGCTIYRTADRLAGFCVADSGADLEVAARDLYRRVFAVTRRLQLYRIWNYVPRINAIELGMENYRRFCRGRSHAFEDHFGRGFQRQLPAASAVGTPGGTLAIAFLAGRDEPHHFENPRQIPAFEYPAVYGPRPPSFSRATVVTQRDTRELFISGTAAIRGHATVAPDDLAGQLACTRENLALIASTAGFDLGAREAAARSFKVYIRHADDLVAVRRDLEQHLLRPTDVVTYVHADLCRADLLVEIEAVVNS